MGNRVLTYLHVFLVAAFENYAIGAFSNNPEHFVLVHDFSLLISNLGFPTIFIITASFARTGRNIEVVLDRIPEYQEFRKRKFSKIILGYKI